MVTRLLVSVPHSLRETIFALLILSMMRLRVSRFIFILDKNLLQTIAELAIESVAWTSTVLKIGFIYFQQ
jgi:hypothetical protein